MKRNGILIAALLAGVLAVGAYAQHKPASEPKSPGAMKGTMMGSMMPEDKAMMAGRQKMMDEMKAGSARLDELVARMNAADGAGKTAAMATLMTEMVAQHKRMHQHMMSMEPDMMKHMMAHMKSGTMEGMQKSMAMCSMMQQADASKSSEAKDDPHAGHKH